MAHADPATRGPRSFKRYHDEVAPMVCAALKASGIDFAVFLPDSLLYPIERLLQDDPDIETYQCSREDEGVGIAIGASLAGRKPVVMMEGSGIGLSGLALARGILQRNGMLLLIAHNSTLGERYDYHGATRLVAEPILTALRIPYHVLFDGAEIPVVIPEAQRTVEGQRTPVAVLFPRHVIRTV